MRATLHTPHRGGPGRDACSREVATVVATVGFKPPRLRRGASIVSHRSPRVAGLVHVSLVTVPKMGLTREIRNFEHLYRHKLRPNYGTWHDTSRLWVLGRTREASPGSYATVVEHTSGASTTAAESALFDSFEFMGEHHKDRLFLSRQALKWIPRLHYTGRRGSQDSTNASNCDITDIWTKREIGNFEHLSRHNPRSDCGTWRNIPRIWVHGGTRKASSGWFGLEG